jgi:hypothetical protein
MDIFSAVLSQFNWAWMDHREGLEDVRYIGPFIFWLLSEKGGQWLLAQAYLTDMLKAFPRFPLAAYPVSYASEEQQARWALESRMVRRTATRNTRFVVKNLLQLYNGCTT